MATFHQTVFVGIATTSSEVRPINHPRESQIVNLWQRLLVNGARLTTDHGEAIEILYPGRRNDGQGADFRDAVVATSGGLVKGDIEIHVQSGDWHAHRHHHNPVYNSVILHVVWKKDSLLYAMVSQIPENEAKGIIWDFQE